MNITHAVCLLNDNEDGVRRVEKVKNEGKIDEISEKTINGIYFSGGLAIHDMDVEIYNTKIHNNYADDGLNVKYGNIGLLEPRNHVKFAGPLLRGGTRLRR